MYLDRQRKNTAQHQRSNKTCYDAKTATARAKKWFTARPPFDRSEQNALIS